MAERDGDLGLYESPPYGFGTPASGEVRADGLTLENEHLRASFDERGRLISLVHRGREALSGPANVFELYEDRPTAYDAWEIEPYVDDTRRALPGARAHEVHAGPLRAEIVFEHEAMRQTVRLDAGARRLEFRTEIDWHETHALLRVAFPLAVRAASATAEMQFGVAERPTHANTQADLARFEVPAHRFADLSEHGFGVALLTPDTHGVAARGSELRLSLLRAPTDPDPDADRGRHEIAYAILPHEGGWQDAGVVAEARTFSEPLRWGAGSGSLRGGRRPRPGARHDQARRGLRRAGPAALRGPRRPRHGPHPAPCPDRRRAPGEPARGRGRSAARPRGRDRARLPPVRGDHGHRPGGVICRPMDLDAAEVRVLGCLIEKQRTTPDVYPLSLNALRTACNQSTSREPVVSYDDDTIRDALHRLGRRRWTRLASGARAAKYRHLLDENPGLARDEQAVLAVLMLRGPQTVAELRSRTERMQHFADGAALQATLDRLAEREFVVRLARRPGQKEERYQHLLSADLEDEPAEAAPAAQPASPAATAASAGEDRLARLERRLEALAAEVAELRAAQAARGGS